MEPSDASTPAPEDLQELEPEQAADRSPADEGIPLPPPTFEFFIMSLKMQTEMQLGLLHFGEEKDRPKADLRVARHSIDLLAMISEKTKGNLSLDEQRLVENSLTELRFRYVQAAGQRGSS